MSHVYHEGPEGAILYDNCPECDLRSADPIEGLLRLDRESADVLWRRMVSVERAPREGRYLTGNERALGRHLYYIAVFEERNSAWLTPDVVWDPERFSTAVFSRSVALP